MSLNSSITSLAANSYERLADNSVNSLVSSLIAAGNSVSFSIVSINSASVNKFGRAEYL